MTTHFKLIGFDLDGTLVNSLPDLALSAAQAAGCTSVGLTYGYNYNIPIAESNPDHIFDNFAQILTLVD